MKKRRAKFRLKILLFIAGLTIILLTLLYAPFFNISSIQVKGNTRYATEAITEMSGIRIGENAFRRLRLQTEAILELRLLDSEERIKQLPYVKTCIVSIVFPNKISISITERQPAAYVRNLDNYLTIDREGYVLEASDERPGGGLKEIKGINFTKFALGSQLEASDKGLITIGTDVINAIANSDTGTEFKLMDVLDWVDTVDRNTVILSLDNRITVRFDPSENIQYTIDFTKEIFFKKINTKETGRLEFSGGQNPSFIPN